MCIIHEASDAFVSILVKAYSFSLSINKVYCNAKYYILIINFNFYVCKLNTFFPITLSRENP
jgi:hypothetical protein